MTEDKPSNVIPFPISYGEAEESLKELANEFRNSKRILLNVKINKSGMLFTITSEYAIFPKTDDDDEDDDA